MAHVRGTKNKIKPLTWATFNNPFPKKKKNKQNKTYKKRRNWNAGLAKKKEEEGEEAKKKKKKKKKKKGVKASEDGDSGVSNPLVFSVLSNFFFFCRPISFFRPKHTGIRPIRSDSAWIDANPEMKKKKKKTGRSSTRRQRRPPRVAASSRIERGCGGHFAASVHPSPLNSQNLRE